MQSDHLNSYYQPVAMLWHGAMIKVGGEGDKPNKTNHGTEQRGRRMRGGRGRKEIKRERKKERNNRGRERALSPVHLTEQNRIVYTISFIYIYTCI